MVSRNVPGPHPLRLPRPRAEHTRAPRCAASRPPRARRCRTPPAHRYIPVSSPALHAIALHVRTQRPTALLMALLKSRHLARHDGHMQDAADLQSRQEPLKRALVVQLNSCRPGQSLIELCRNTQACS